MAIYLQTARLIIRDPLPTDLEGWHSLISDSEAMYYLQDIMTQTEEESRQNLEIAISEARSPDRTKYFFAVEHGQTGEFIGSAGYTVTGSTPFGKFVGMGYFLLPKHQGKGYATEAIGEVIRFAFEDDNVFRISTGCLKENIGSEKVMIKCGMIKEGDYKHHTWHDGQIKDRISYRLLKSEWEQARGMRAEAAD